MKKGLYLPNAITHYNGMYNMSFNQYELRRSLENIWNAQDRLSKEDLELLTKLGNK